LSRYGTIFIWNYRERKNDKLLINVNMLKAIAITKYMMIGKINESSVPAIATIIILNAVITNPLKAVPIVNFDTTDSDK
jgi:hypothetical protein